MVDSRVFPIAPLLPAVIEMRIVFRSACGPGIARLTSLVDGYQSEHDDQVEDEFGGGKEDFRVAEPLKTRQTVASHVGMGPTHLDGKEVEADQGYGDDAVHDQAVDELVPLDPKVHLCRRDGHESGKRDRVREPGGPAPVRSASGQEDGP